MFDLISPAAFSSLWYWIVTALVWSRLVNAPLGVSADLYDRARSGEDGENDAFVLIRLGVERHLGIMDRLGPVLAGLWAFVLSTLAMLAVVYRLELAQAIFLILAPVALCQGMITRTARRMTRMDPDIDILLKALRNLRITLQVIGLASIFCAALFGMIHNLQSVIF